jgi:hypothetical protein
MKIEEQNIAIAKICGWKLRWQNVGGGPLYELKPKDHCWEVWLPPPNKINFQEEWPEPPDYFSDLNAMHEAEKSLPTIFETAEYQDQLELVTNRQRNPIWFATASQRAEAFLKTLGLWND